MGKRQRAGKGEELGTKPRAGSQRRGHHWERPTRTVGMVEKDQPRDQAGAGAAPRGPRSQDGTARLSGHNTTEAPRAPPAATACGPWPQRAKGVVPSLAAHQRGSVGR